MRVHFSHLATVLNYLDRPAEPGTDEGTFLAPRWQHFTRARRNVWTGVPSAEVTSPPTEHGRRRRGTERRRLTFGT